MSALQFLSINELDCEEKRVLVRTDLNVPLKDGKITDATRINRSMPTLHSLLRRRARIIITSHVGRPTGDKEKDKGLSLKPIADFIQGLLPKVTIHFAADCVGDEIKAAVDKVQPGEIIILENLRFHKQEKKNDPHFADQLAALADFYVNDAFSTSHRAHASVVAITQRLPSAAGLLMEEELWSLGRALESPERPLMAVASGAKVSTKIELLSNLVKKVDYLVLGGGMATTVFAAQGKEIGNSLNEPTMHDSVREMLKLAEEHKCEVVLPVDAVVASEFKSGAKTSVVSVDAIPKDQMVLDIGPKTVELINSKLQRTKTVVWNGPLGAFELQGCEEGTRGVAKMVADLTAQNKLLSVAGGGDTVAALAQLIPDDRFSYVSTAGGAFMEWMEGKVLPGVSALNAAYSKTGATLRLTIADIMTKEVVSLSEDEAIGGAKALLDMKKIRHVPIVSKTGTFVGLMTHRDLLRLSVSTLTPADQAAAEQKKIDQVPLKDVMQKDIITVGPELSVAAAARTLVDHKFGCLPVVSKGGQLVGIVTEADFARLMLQLLQDAEDMQVAITKALKLRSA